MFPKKVEVAMLLEVELPTFIWSNHAVEEAMREIGDARSHKGVEVAEVVMP